jgi:glycoside/pentoside/hexuronide:cation symporter, GPH family
VISRRERWSFAAGDLGFNFVWQSTELYLLFFYITVAGLSPKAAAAIFLIGTIVDWGADPVIGVLVDKFADRIPVRLWVVLGGPLSGLALAIVFAQPILAGVGRAGWAFAVVTHVALRISYSLGNIPYGALTSRISADPADHILLTGARMQGAALGGLIATGVFAILPAKSPGGDANFLLGAVLLVLLAQPAFLATYLGVKERVKGPLAPGRGASYLSAFARLIGRSAELRRLLAIVFAAGLSITVVNKSIMFLFQEIGQVRLGYIAALLPSLSLLLTAPIWVAMARRIGRQTVLLCAAALNLVAAIGLFVLPASGPSLIAIVVIAVVAGNGMSMMFWSLAPDVVDRIEHEEGAEACAARVFACVGISRKLAQALAPQFVTLGLVLSIGQSVSSGILVVAILTFLVIVAYRPAQRMETDGR